MPLFIQRGGPLQVDACNANGATADARLVLREAADTGLVVVDGKLIEKPVLREMKRRLLLGSLQK